MQIISYLNFTDQKKIRFDVKDHLTILFFKALRSSLLKNQKDKYQEGFKKVLFKDKPVVPFRAIRLNKSNTSILSKSLALPAKTRIAIFPPAVADWKKPSSNCKDRASWCAVASGLLEDFKMGPTKTKKRRAKPVFGCYHCRLKHSYQTLIFMVGQKLIELRLAVLRFFTLKNEC